MNYERPKKGLASLSMETPSPQKSLKASEVQWRETLNHQDHLRGQIYFGSRDSNWTFGSPNVGKEIKNLEERKFTDHEKFITDGQDLCLILFYCKVLTKLKIIFLLFWTSLFQGTHLNFQNFFRTKWSSHLSYFIDIHISSSLFQMIPGNHCFCNSSTKLQQLVAPVASVPLYMFIFFVFHLTLIFLTTTLSLTSVRIWL